MKKKLKKNSINYYCQKCDFSSKNKNDYRRHLSTTKHKMGNMDNEMDNLKNSKPTYKCICGKAYKYNSGLSKHKKKCKALPDGLADALDNTLNILDENDPLTVDMFNKIVQQNCTLMEKLVELSKEKQVIHYQNCHNKKMTINVFLNEQCKNAMNLTDFVENVKVSLEDLRYTKEHGYIKGISNIFVKHLKDMHPTERPIHCSDKKRLQFYVKEENKWGKDGAHEKIDKSIEDITVKQIKRIKEWEKNHPNYLQNEKLLQEWHTMIQQIMGGGEDVERARNKEQIKKSLGTTIEIKDAMVVKD